MAGDPIRSTTASSRGSGIAWTRGERLIRRGGGALSFLLLAAVLGPRDYGLFALAISGIAVVETALSEVACAPLIRIARLEAAHLSTAFLSIVAIGIAISLVLYGVGSGVAVVSEEPALGDMFRSLALLPLLAALAAVPIGRLRRRGSGAGFALATATGVLAGGIVGLALATAGAGAWALAAQAIVYRLCETAVLWGAGGRGIGLRWSRRHAVELAGLLDLSALLPAIKAVGRQVPLVLVALALGPIAAGLYVVGARLLEGVCEVLLPAAGDRRPCDVATLANGVAWIVVPALLGGAAGLAILLPAVLDSAWWAAVGPARILLIAAIPAGIQHLRAMLPKTGAEDRRETRFAVGQIIVGSVIAAVAAPYGVEFVAAGGVIQSGLAALVCLRPIGRALGEHRAVALFAATGPLAAAAVLGALVFTLADRLTLMPPSLAMAWLILAGGLAWGLPALVPSTAWRWPTRLLPAQIHLQHAFPPEVG